MKRVTCSAREGKNTKRAMRGDLPSRPKRRAKATGSETNTLSREKPPTAIGKALNAAPQLALRVLQ